MATTIDLGSIIGPPGPPGKVETTIHNQTTPSATWTITHGFGRYPAVTIVDSAGSVVMGKVDYVDDNTITVSFEAAFSGKAYLN